MMTLMRLVAVVVGISIANAQSCTVTDFSVVGPYTSSPEQCDTGGCTWYLETRYADCETFCNLNGMECDSAQVVGEGLSFVGCAGLEAAGTTDIACAGDGVPKARYSRVCTCKSHDREYSSVTDGCKGANTEVEDACLAVDEEAAIRCCSKDGSSNFCDSFCPGNVAHTLANYATAVATCESNGLRLCKRSEIDAGDCCGTGCQYDAHQTWILEEQCFPSQFTLLEGSYTRLPVTNDWHHVTITVNANGTGATWSNAAGRSWQLTQDPSTGNLIAPASPYGHRVLTVARDDAGRATGVYFLGELYEASPLRSLAGLYTRLPITNDWHYVEIALNGDDTSATWRNAAGRTWGLEKDSSNGTLQIVAPATPYGHRVVGVEKETSGQVTGVRFLNEVYSVSPFSGIEGSYTRLPVTNDWHHVTITRADATNMKIATWNNAAGRTWQLELDTTTGDLIAPASPYGHRVLSVNRDVDGSVTGVVFLGEVYHRS